MASTNPRATASPSPDAAVVRLVAEPLERLEHSVALIGWNARAAVDDPKVDSLADAARIDPHRVLGRGPRDRVVDDVRDGALEERGVGVDTR